VKTILSAPSTMTKTAKATVSKVAIPGWVSANAPSAIAKGERVEFVMTSTTMMNHPMHLHGHVFQVVAVNGKRYAGAMRDTVLVPPKTSVTIGFDANNPGKWFYHCHNLYHMMSGMAKTLVYE
jgi:FtsP/CotA-like multicopper oxidase with cupredoxin domain